MEPILRFPHREVAFWPFASSRCKTELRSLSEGSGRQPAGKTAGSVENDAVDGAHSAASRCHRVVALKQTTLRGAVHGRSYHDWSRYCEVGISGSRRAQSRSRNQDCCQQQDRPRASTNWQGHDDVMQIRSFRGSGEPVWVNALSSACERLGPDPRRALGPAATPAASTGRTRDRTRPMLQNGQKVLARAPSTRDPKPTSC